MAFSDLREFVAHLERRGRLRRITTPVSRDLEITEIVDRVSKRRDDGNVALLFERVQGFEMPVLVNAFGSAGRMATALGVERLDDLGARVSKLLDLKMPGSFLDKMRKLGTLLDVAKAAPRRVGAAPCQEIVETENPSLAGLPILTCWPRDGGRYITLPAVFTRDPVTGARNVGMYRLQVFDDRTLGMHWQTHKGGAEHEHRATSRMPVAIALGGDPAMIYAASAPLPPGIDEVVFAGWLRGEGVELVPCRTIDLEVPAQAEIVLEGYVDPTERRLEGPFGDHTGYYSLADEFPVFNVTAITHRKKPVYHTIIVGPPVQEDCFMGGAIERLFLPLMKMQLQEVVDYHMPYEGIFHNLMIVSIRKQFPGHARKVMHAIWGLPQAMFSKVIVVVDEDVNPRDYREVAWKALNHIDPERDFEFVLGPIDILDHSSRLPGLGSHVGIDATRKWPGEGFTRPWPDEIKMSPEIKAVVDKKWRELGL